MVQMSDVAKRAGVSTATVSRVLRFPEKVKVKTREKVLEAITELNYQPNILARQFRRSETRTILVVVPDISNYVFSHMVRGIEMIAMENDYKVIIGHTNINENLNYEYIDLLRQKQVDGMVLFTGHMERELLEELSRDYPVVLVSDYIENSDIPSVSIDNINSARLITEHLIQLGHTKIGTITGPLNLMVSQCRLNGFREAMKQYGLEVNPSHIQEGEYDYESGFLMMKKLLATNNPPTAVFAASDEMAFGAINAARELGYNCPHDISVVGFDNIKFSTIFRPALTTIGQPVYEMGRKAMEILLKRINDETLIKRQFVLESELIIRDSCKKI